MNLSHMLEEQEEGTTTRGDGRCGDRRTLRILWIPFFYKTYNDFRPRVCAVRARVGGGGAGGWVGEAAAGARRRA